MKKQSTVFLSTLRKVIAAGWQMIGVDNGGDQGIDRSITTPQAALAEFKEVDQLYVFVQREGKQAWLRYIWQGPDDDKSVDGEEVLCDYITSLDSALT